MKHKQLHVVPNQIKDAQDFLQKLQKDEKGFLNLANLLKNIAGITLANNSKSKSLMASRLSSFLRSKDIATYTDYINYIHLKGIPAKKELVAAMTTHTTQFFREPSHFRHLCTHLPKLLQLKQKKGESELRIWCAAASSGQEPLTIAFQKKKPG